jgi:uncharacterized protein YcfJ
MVIVGYRYGKGSGCSYNTATGRPEAGLSMAAAEGLPECRSFATQSAKTSRKDYYYTGDFAGFGSDDEILISNPVQITKREYSKMINQEAAREIAKIKIENFGICKNYELNHRRPVFDQAREAEIIAEITTRYEAKIREWTR